MPSDARSAATCCPTFAAGYGVHYSNCPNYDPAVDAQRLQAALAKLAENLAAENTSLREQVNSGRAGRERAEGLPEGTLPRV